MINSCLTTEGRFAFLQGRIQPGHVFKLALYTDKANLGEDTVCYTPINEVVGQGYAAIRLANPVFARVGKLAVMNFPGELLWKNATISAAGCMIFDETLDNLAIAVGSFGSIISSTNDTFRLDPPENLVIFK